MEYCTQNWEGTSGMDGMDGMDDRDETTEKTTREHEMAIGTAVVLERVQLPILLRALQARGYEVIGPVLRDGAIVYDKIADVDDLPIGWTDEQDAGRYRVRRRDDAAVFGYTVGPHSWKHYLHPPRLSLARLRRNGAGYVPTHE